MTWFITKFMPIMYMCILQLTTVTTPAAVMVETLPPQKEEIQPHNCDVVQIVIYKVLIKTLFSKDAGLVIYINCITAMYMKVFKNIPTHIHIKSYVYIYIILYMYMKFRCTV